MSDLLRPDGEIMSFEELKMSFKIKGTNLDYLGLVRSLPGEWKRRNAKQKPNYPIIHPNIQAILENRQGNSHIYRILLRRKSRDIKNTWESTWEREFGEIEWSSTYVLSRDSTRAVAYQSMQYKLITKIIVTNRRLHCMGLVETPQCDYCPDSLETISHKFWDCPRVQNFWKEIAVFLKNLGLYPNLQSFTKKDIILGFGESKLVNHILLIAKSMIVKGLFLSTDILMMKVLMDKNIEKCISNIQNTERAYTAKWQVLEDVIRNTGNHLLMHQ